MVKRAYPAQGNPKEARTCTACICSDSSERYVLRTVLYVLYNIEFNVIIDTVP